MVGRLLHKISQLQVYPCVWYLAEQMMSCLCSAY